MPEYTFENLSGAEFETLARDLLQKHLGLTLQSFPAGRDGGIDLLFTGSNDNEIVVQCKQYAQTGFSGLMSIMRKEAKKLQQVQPGRYILVTSASLTNQNKKDLKALLKPWCKNTSDIFGPNDLNNLLGKFPDVIQDHPKLWLSSVSVLQRLLQPGSLGMTAAEVSELRDKLRIIVPTAELDTVLQILKQRHVCIISGIPGIGKSTLADLAFLHYVEKGYQAIKIWPGLAEAKSLFEPTKKQILYFDDFLGQAALDLRHNQAPELASLIRAVKKSPNSRLILTTRENILNRARLLSQTVDDTLEGLSSCVVSLKGYSKKVRASILFNHVFFSDLPEEFKREFSKPEVYRRIVRHPSFSPRIVALTLGSLMNPKKTTPARYVEEFVANLDNPEKVWTHAFRGLDAPGQHLSLLLMSLPRMTDVDAVRTAYGHFHSRLAQRYTQPMSPYDFADSLRELLGTFLTTAHKQGKVFVWYQNPSVEDFMRGHLNEHQDLLEDLIASSVYPDQLQQLSLRFFEQMTPRISGVALQALNRVYDSAQLSARRGETMSGEELFELAVAFYTDAKDPCLAPEMRQIVNKFMTYLDAGTPNRLELSFLLLHFKKGRIPGESRGGKLHSAILNAILGTSGEWFPDLQDLTIMAEVINSEGEYVAQHLVDEVRIAFEQSVQPELDAIEDMGEREMMWDTLEDLESIAHTLGVDLGDARDRVAEWVEELGEDSVEDEQVDSKTLDEDEELDQDEADIDNMFIRLRSGDTLV